MYVQCCRNLSQAYELPRRSHLTGSTIIGCMIPIINDTWNAHLTSNYSYDMIAIEGSIANQGVSDPADLSFLVDHMRELPDEVRKYLLWAAFFGET